MAGIFPEKFKSRIAIVDQEEIKFVEFDAVVKETHTGGATPTDHPVESQTDMTDHIRRLPEELELQCIVSNTPIMMLASFRATPSVPGTDPSERAEAAYFFLVSVKDQGQLVSVTTELRDYTNMAIKNLVCSRDKDTSQIVDISISLREIQVVATETVKAKPAEPAKKKKKNLGKKAKTEAPEPTAKSALARLFGIFGG